MMDNLKQTKDDEKMKEESTPGGPSEGQADLIKRLELENLELKRELLRRRAASSALRRMVQGAREGGGADILCLITRHMCVAFGLSSVCVGEVTSGRVRAVAVCGRRSKADGVSCGCEKEPDGFVCNEAARSVGSEFDAEGTPYGEVLSGRYAIYHDGVAGAFPSDVTLKGMSAFFGVPLFNASGDVIGVLAGASERAMAFDSEAKGLVSIFASIAGIELERRWAVERLKQSELHMKEAQRLAHVGHWEWDIQKDSAIWADELYEIFGTAPGTRIDLETFLGLVHPLDRERVKKTISDILAGIGPLEMEYRIIRPDGNERTIIERGETVFGSNGQPLLLKGMAQDITWIRSTEAELMKADRLDSLGAFASAVAHDFNNILLSILGSVSVARTYLKPDDRVSVCLSDIEKASMRARSLTRQVLTLSKSGVPVKGPLRICELARSVCSMVVRSTEARCSFDLPSALWQVEADEAQISQVLNNIILNARQAMDDSGTITIDAENAVLDNANCLGLKEGRYVRLSVRDHGRGIGADIIGRVFEPFFTTRKKASGLGLAVSYSIVKKHGGMITVDSEKGAGSSFHLWLPAYAPEALSQAEGGAYKAGARVLVVDDDDLVRDVMAMMLSTLGYEPTLTSSGAEAIELYSKARSAGAPYDLAILDLSVPGMDGIETLRRLKEIDPGVKAIISTGNSHDPVVADFRSFGFAGALVKPYVVSDFASIVKRVISLG